MGGNIQIYNGSTFCPVSDVKKFHASRRVVEIEFEGDPMVLAWLPNPKTRPKLVNADFATACHGSEGIASSNRRLRRKVRRHARGGKKMCSGKNKANIYPDEQMECMSTRSYGRDRSNSGEDVREP